MSSANSILITGGGGGIGLEIARLLASCEHSLILVGRDAVRLQTAANELRATHGTEVHAHSVDLSEPGLHSGFSTIPRNMGSTLTRSSTTRVLASSMHTSKSNLRRLTACCSSMS